MAASQQMSRRRRLASVTASEAVAAEIMMARNIGKARRQPGQIEALLGQRVPMRGAMPAGRFGQLPQPPCESGCRLEFELLQASGDGRFEMCADLDVVEQRNLSVGQSIGLFEQVAQVPGEQFGKSPVEAIRCRIAGEKTPGVG